MVVKLESLADWKLARSLVEPLYEGQVLNSGESRLAHSDAMVEIIRSIRDDSDLLTAAYLFSVDDYMENANEWIEKKFGKPVLQLVTDMHRLMDVSQKARSENKEAQAVYQPEALRKMVLAMCHDLRVVILRLASRVQTLRFFSQFESSAAARYGEETLAVYAPLANRLGIWQMKWELEDLSLRFTEPEKYFRISQLLAQSRNERLQFLEETKVKMTDLLRAEGISRFSLSARPKHIYSICKKMERKHYGFDQLYDIHAMRIIVEDVETCYKVLSVIQNNFLIVTKEYDDYIANPKPNGYQSLHTVIMDQKKHPVEVQIRTRAMHDFAELGVAAHWRYKENGNSNKVVDTEEQKVAWLRQVIAWKSDVALPDHPGFQDEHIYALTPQGRVMEMPAHSTPIDFAYQIHTELGHRCRGAKVNGAMVPLNTELKTGDTVEIIAAKEGGPSRDWINPELGFAACPRTRTKVRQWFNAQVLEQQISAGREKLDKELARLGKTATNLEDLAKRLSFDAIDDMCVAFAKEELSPHAIEQALLPVESVKPADPAVVVHQKKHPSKSNILVVGMDSMMTQLARCCHPAPPDEIVGFVTRGKGVTVHRLDCSNVKNLANINANRMIDVSWGSADDAIYPVDILIVARNSDTLLKEISEVFYKESQRVIGMSTMTVRDDVHMKFSIEIRSSADMERSLAALREIKGVLNARRV